ncbi:Serine/threonine-protein kinase PknD [Alphaproteobacteria bacterium SO-S41]|nr:Serine/threonine-protein kinase PknD [Alphaproteobacteria bacterium SO-S41]
MKRRPSEAEWRSIGEIFDTLVGMPAARRAEMLNLRTSDPFIRAEVEAMLESSLRAGLLDLMTEPVEPADQPEGETLSEGTLIGAFRIERLLGRGGAGEVYLARRQTDDFDQRVALKLLQPEATAQAAAFDAERRLLSQLEHPGIARLIDGGTTEDGRIFMAMEYVDGTDIVSWCRETKADLATRLKLFAEVCDAVAYAHRRLIVHRDLKPSNIMVDGDSRVRLLDFGIAGIVDPDLSDGLTRGATPAYAAPEQFEGDAPTTAMDVYGLGATLFELLAGRGAWSFEATSLPTALRRLLHGAAPAASKVAEEEKDKAVPGRLLRGDLDAIVAKAMQADPARRYDSVAALAEDLRRHRAHEPVSVRAGDRLYAVGRFLRRNRWAAVASAAAIVAVITGVTGIALQMRETAIERDIAREEASRAEAINQGISLMFGEASDTGKAKTATAKELLDATAAKLIETIDPANANQAAMVLALGELYASIDDATAVDGLLGKALEKGVGRDDAVMTADLKLQLAIAKAALGAFPESRQLMAEAQPVWDGAPERFRVQRLEAIATGASILSQEGHLDDCIRLLTDSLPEAERAYAPGSREILVRYINLATHLYVAGRFDETKHYLALAERAAEQGGRQRSSTALSMLTLHGMLAAKEGDIEGMERYMREAVGLRRELYGPSAALAGDLFGLGMALLTSGKPAEAVPVLEESATMMETYAGRAPQTAIPIAYARVDALCALHRPDEAEAVLKAVDDLAVEAGNTSLVYGMYLRARAAIRLEQGRYDEAGAALDEAEAVFKPLGPQGEGFLSDIAKMRATIAERRGG